MYSMKLSLQSLTVHKIRSMITGLTSNSSLSHDL